MADNLKRRQPEDPTKVNVNEKWEVDYWTNKWGVTEQQLRDAVKSVGVMTKDVAKKLGKTA
ncbi:DUF3606 domain-containing protein [Aureimonas jatrophae]|uniref:DUF3606 domain-containing protein n=1 Tax=Aureimonas jatrophae TaxID=1166073 RepID=A0A1H0J9F3_9HYPH|nr:DUF3606 domain-containing protein [Aureimonas jatrophae]MBB3951522.1 hypothetical protein [Aureimonas jatrophae]SDO40395.1 Protein of unknown function [Aureimonas jatrophae]